MIESFSVGTYWEARRESANECAHRTHQYFQTLSSRDPSFNRWYRPRPKVRGSAGPVINIGDIDELKADLERGRIRTDLTKKVMEELGFSLSTWNDRVDSIDLRIHCGGYSTFNTNVCVMSFPYQGEVAERLLNLPMLTQLLLDMVEAWEPEAGLIDTNNHMLMSPQGTSAYARVGWVTYVAKSRGTVPPLPAPVRIDPVGDKGMLITLTPERFTASNPEHVALAARVRELLDRAGLLRPSQQ